MTNWFERLTVECQLEASAAHALQEDGFVVIEGPVPRPAFDQLVTTYDRVMDEATEPDKRVGRQNTRVHDLVNRAGAFDGLYLYPPVLAACCQVIRQPFKLSNVLGRTLHPQSEAEQLHVDTAGDQKGWPILGFILMIDQFATVNGATRFVPGSHRRPMSASEEPLESEVVPACGPQGAMVVYNGSVLHGHGSNRTDRARRSIQGAFIRRNSAGFGLADRISSETRQRIGPLAQYLIAL